MKEEKNYISERSRSISHSGIREMYNLALEDENAIHLEIGESDFPTPQYIIDAAKKALDDGFTGYTPNSGYLDLRVAIADKLERDNGFSAEPATEIIVTAGAMQALSLAILVTINPGDEVIIPDPGYESFSRQVKFAGGIPVPVELREEKNFAFDKTDLEKAITQKTKMIVLNTPSNPTGGMMNKEELQDISQVAESYDLLVLSDEIYEKIVYDGRKHVSIASLPGMRERTISVFGVSKTHSMTGWRVGYAVGNESIVAEMNKIQEFYVTCATSVSQRAAIAALEGPSNTIEKMVKHFQDRRNLFYSKLSKHELIHSTKPQGAFYLFPNISGLGLRSEKAAKFLYERGGVVTVPGKAFGESGDDFLRLSFAKSKPELNKAVERIHSALNQIF